jgi:uncharacterized protein (TIGR03067 family)
MSGVISFNRAVKEVFMSIRAFVIPAVLVVSAMGAGPESGDLNKLQGTWEASVGKKQEFSVTLEVKGNDVTATIKPKKGPKLKANGELQIDEKASPRKLDWVKFSTPDGIEVPKMLSIYRLEGEKLYVRSGGFNDSRPKAFEAGGEGLWSEVVVFTRPAKTEAITANP